MSSHDWSPRPRRDMNLNGLFQFVEEAPIQKSQSAMARQRAADGSPLTRTPLSGLRPADMPLYMKGHEPVQKSVPTKEEQEKKMEEAVCKAYDIVKSYISGR